MGIPALTPQPNYQFRVHRRSSAFICGSKCGSLLSVFIRVYQWLKKQFAVLRGLCDFFCRVRFNGFPGAKGEGFDADFSAISRDNH